jgi:uncharacterized membrane protein YhiD involved in acid resistance
MNIFRHALANILNVYQNQAIDTTVVLSVLMVVLLLSMYEFLIYRVVSHRAFYNRSFNICISVIPFFIATIILCLQSNIVITLGTIGALYLLWSVHIGITCGCQLYEIAVLTSLTVTVVLILMNYVSVGRRPFILVFQCSTENDGEVLESIKKITSKYHIKSRNYTQKGMNYVIEFSVKDPKILTDKLKELEIEKFSVIEYDSEDVI